MPTGHTLSPLNKMSGKTVYSRTACCMVVGDDTRTCGVSEGGGGGWALTFQHKGLHAAGEGEFGGGQLPLLQVPNKLGGPRSDDVQCAQHGPRDHAQVPDRFLGLHLCIHEQNSALCRQITRPLRLRPSPFCKLDSDRKLNSLAMPVALQQRDAPGSAVACHLNHSVVNRSCSHSIGFNLIAPTFPAELPPLFGQLLTTRHIKVYWGLGEVRVGGGGEGG